MNIQELQHLFSRHPRVKALGKLLTQSNRRGPIQLTGLQASATPMMFAALAQACPQAIGVPYVFVLDDMEEAGYFFHDLTQILGDEQVLFFPSTFKRAVRFGQRDAANEILRTEVLSRISTGALPLFIVTYPEALAELVVTREKLSQQTLVLHTGERVDTQFVQETLISFGFRRVDYVYEPGQFAVRGSLIDVYSFSCETPYRIDFFGDEVDSIRTFKVEDQLSLAKQQSISIVPALNESTERRENVLSFLPADSLLIMKDLTYLCERIEQVWQEGFSQQALIVQDATSEVEELEMLQQLRRESLLVQPTDFQAKVLDFRRVLIGNHIPQKQNGLSVLEFSIHPQPVFHKNFDLLFSSLQDYLQQDYELFILADSSKQADRLESIFHDQQTGITFTPVDRTLHAGFVDDDLHLCCFTDHQIFDRFHKYNLKSDHARNTKMALTLKELMQFQPGDYVVHVDHGIGQFAGLAREMMPDGQMREVIKLNYKNGGSILVSIHSLHKLSKYRGRDGEPPRISALGTGAWERIKEKTKSKLKDIARDLILLYSRRREEKGHAFSRDNFMQQELEASFTYEDTPDQLKVTQQVKADMERQQPMDRLVCGDVGFGKTEIAVRAAFKAACDGKQTAVLVPTTVLALQHYKTFEKRLKKFPVRIEYLSRARSAQKTKTILADLKEGKIDIIIGTHKLIGKTVAFKDLGLLIIDEEQKFGVSVKERLRQLKASVDTLTMSATPIPRTLQFSLMGARDLSVINTPPPNRRPIQTEIHTFGHEIIADAINFELSRNGQVYIVTHRINRLDEIAAVIRHHVPDARLAIGHGQMPPTKLEQIVEDFVNHEVDVLLSTTIVENGIDVANANTIIIDSAHHFGLSELHQMRGRVGRSDRKAFCYLLAPPLSALPDDSRRRLQAIENFSDLGSGIHIAMQDLDIRGAGNLLGAEQSGFIADLGYEPEFGARPLKRTLQAEVETRLARLILSEDLSMGDVLLVDAEEGQITVRVK